MFKLEAQPEVIASKLEPEKVKEFYKGVLVNPLRFYCPSGAQEQYINTVVHSTRDTKIPVILCTFANGAGKTSTTINILLNFIYGPQNGWFDHSIFKNFLFPKTIWYISTSEAFKETIQPMFEEMLKGKKYESFRDGKHFISKMVFPKGWQIFFKTFDQDIKTFESTSVGIGIMDEPGPEAIWKALKGRRRRGCLIMLPMTPLDCPPYIVDEISNAAEKNLRGYYHLGADIYTACKNRGIRGYLDPEIIDDMVANYDSEERQARAYGKFMYFSRLIYAELSREKHFVEPSEYPIPLHSRIFHIVDPHDARPSAAIWGAKTPTGRWIVFDEYPIEKNQPFWEMKGGLDVETEIKIWANIEEKLRMDEIIPSYNIKRILDRQFGWQLRGNKTFAELYAQAGNKIGKNFKFMSSYKAVTKEGEVEFGHKQVRKALGPMEDWKPGLVIWNNCYHTWNGLTHYVRRKLTGKTADDKAAADGVIMDKYKDFGDLLRYAVCCDIVPEEVKKEEKRKKYYDWKVL